MGDISKLSLDRRLTSPNYNDRGGACVDCLVIHHTATQSCDTALNRFLDAAHPDGKLSSHYLIDEDGHIFYLVDEAKRAYHAGVSCWSGRDDLNTYSIGIELAHPGWTAGHGFTQSQLDALEALGLDIVQRYHMPARHVLGHSDIAADRKSDPGYWFPWEEMARAGLGVWPCPGAEDESAADAAESDPDRWHDWLHDYGYCKSYKKGDLMYAFYQHFYPEAFANTHDPDPHRPDKQALARLHRLVQLKRQDSGLSLS